MNRRQFCTCAALFGLVFYAWCGWRHVCFGGHFRHPPYGRVAILIDALWAFPLGFAAVAAIRAAMPDRILLVPFAFVLILLRLFVPGHLLELPFAAMLLALALANLARPGGRSGLATHPIALTIVLGAGLATGVLVRAARAGMPSPATSVAPFVNLFSPNARTRDHALCRIRDEWHDAYTPMILEVWRVSQDAGFNSFLLLLLQEKTGQDLGLDRDAWFEWVWQQEFDLHPQYADFKAALYSRIDPVFQRYFDSRYAATIRLDEIRWGNVTQDGIPPLRGPRMISSARADYLADTDVVFGIEINGHARAYPKRILGWHELVVDDVDGIQVAGVYCTLCGSMIAYKADHDGIRHELGTSGFLYRSNKLMFDRATQSLWSTLQGRPVVGPLVGRDIELERLGVVTTTWGEWKRRHPLSHVLALPTDFRRNYTEGAAYREYFASDDLMFRVPTRDSRLRNKDPVLAVRLPGQSTEPLAISVDFLLTRPIYHDRVGSVDLVVLTDPSGASRVYASSDVRFTRYDGRAKVLDDRGHAWTMTEQRLTSEHGQQLARLPVHRAFWFGWHAAFPDTRLVAERP